MKKYLKYFVILAIIFFIYSSINSLRAENKTLQTRVSTLENKIGIDTLDCSPADIENLLSNRVVRIIGAYGEGSGFPINDKQIITSFHVIDGDPSPKVVFPSGVVENPYSIVGDRDADIALLTINTSEHMSPFKKPEKAITAGQTVYSAGYALGSELVGIATISKGTYTGSRQLQDYTSQMVQTDISLVEGMSGGPLVDECGNIIGINTAGLSGLSLFVDYRYIEPLFDEFSSQDIEKISIDTSTPLGVVESYYSYIRLKDLKNAFNLISEEKLEEGETFRDWRQGFRDTLYITVVMIETDNEDNNKVKVKLRSGDWIDGNLVEKFFEGYWIVNSDMKLSESNIKEVTDPGWNWYWGWDE